VSGPGIARTALLALVLVAAFGAMAGTALAKKAPQVDIVSHGEPPAVVPPNTHYFTTIQGAVNATHKGDWVLIAPGTYAEQVFIGKTHQGIHVRGMNRNTVVLDGEHKPGDGILIEKANNVWVENLTAHDYDGTAAIWWTGGTESKKQNVHGWFGKYLTAYQTDQGGGYGIFTQNEHEGWWEHVYSSGFNDSGLYIGACWECKARVTDATIEKNSVGYSGSNSGGNLVIEKSTFRDNGAGIVPNGENPGDGPPPQNGMCHAKRPASPYHLFTTTNIERCTVIKENLVTENNNLETPVNGSTEIAPWGVGVELPGDMADLVENNTITKNVNDGVLGFEYPNPFPPEADTIYYQFTGNKIANNTFSENGGSNRLGADVITLEGGLFPHGKYTSDNNCSTANTTPDGVQPLDLETTFNCSHATTPPPTNALLLQYVIELSEENAMLHKGSVQPAPGPQPTMPEPCEGVPANPLCP
jgi:hypothetical protein